VRRRDVDVERILADEHRLDRLEGAWFDARPDADRPLIGVHFGDRKAADRDGQRQPVPSAVRGTAPASLTSRMLIRRTSVILSLAACAGF
jgi:hypothetical protein